MALKPTCAILYGLISTALLSLVIALPMGQVLSVGLQGSYPISGDSPLAQAKAASHRTVSASEILAQALHHIPRYPPLTARVRLLSHVFDSELAGYGDYYQATINGRVCTRYELRLPVADRAATWQQVSDGDYLWWRADIDGTATLDLVDLRRLRQWEAATRRNLPPVAGLAGLLDRLKESVHFSSVRQDRLGSEPVWIISGEVKLSGDIPSTQNRDEFFRRNPQFPTEVVIYLSQDETLAYFPFRFEFRRDAVRTGPGDHNRPVMVLEFYEVRSGEPVDSRWFHYTPGEQPFTDRTEEWLRKLEPRMAGQPTASRTK
jgi:hypothetical protein